MKVILVVLSLVIAAVVAVSENECPPDQEWDWTIEKLLRHPDCDKFYKCTYGQPVEQNCPSGLWFCLDNMRCEWPHLVDCTDRNVPGATSTTTPSTTTTTTTTTTPAPTTTTTTTTTTPAPTTTTTTTTTTTPAPTTTTTTTPAPSPTTSTPNITTTQGPSTTPEIRPNGCPVNPHIHWLLAHETDCSQFYYCVWGMKVLRNCSDGRHFNQELQVCDWPQDAGCVAA